MAQAVYHYIKNYSSAGKIGISYVAIGDMIKETLKDVENISIFGALRNLIASQQDLTAQSAEATAYYEILQKHLLSTVQSGGPEVTGLLAGRFITKRDYDAEAKNAMLRGSVAMLGGFAGSSAGGAIGSALGGDSGQIVGAMLGGIGGSQLQNLMGKGPSILGLASVGTAAVPVISLPEVLCMPSFQVCYRGSVQNGFFFF